MKKIAIIFCICYLSVCVSADKDSSKVKFGIADAGKLNSNEIKKRIGDLEVDLDLIDKSESEYFQDLFHNLVVDSVESGYYYLMSNFVIGILKIRNSGSGPYKFHIKNLKLKIRNRELIPVAPKEMPKTIERFNFKGNLKNVYNFTVVTAATAFVIVAVVGCAKEGKCGGIQHVDTVLNVASSGEKNPENVFSSVTHETNFEFENIFPVQKELKPGEAVSGVIFFQRPSLFSLATFSGIFQSNELNLTITGMH